LLSKLASMFGDLVERAWRTLAGDISRRRGGDVPMSAGYVPMSAGSPPASRQYV
jgi:hypothetical protein